MDRLLAAVLLGLSIAATAQVPAPSPSAAAPPPRQARVFVIESASWSSHAASGSGFGLFGGVFAGGSVSQSGAGARPQTAEIIKTLGQRCPQFVANNQQEVSDYVIRLDHEGGKGLVSKRNKIVVFARRSGDSIFSASTVTLGGAVQEACAALDRHWAANAAALAEPEAKASSTSLLVVEASAAGADIEVDGEFVGSTPSTLTVAQGKHNVTVKKKGYADWSRTLTVPGGNVHLNAELVAGT